MNYNDKKTQCNVLYYSKFSNMCIDLLKMMDSYGVINQFCLKCIDDMAQMPPGLERVPTLIIVGVNRPFVAKDAITWFNNMRPIFMQQNTDMQNKKIMYNIMRNNMQAISGPKGYIQAEHDGISDGFAYTDLDSAQPKTYYEYNETNKDFIYTPPKEDMRMNRTEQDKLVKSIEAERKKYESECATNMRRDQIIAVMNTEKDQLIKNKLGI